MGRFLRSVSTDTVDPRQYKNTQEFTAAGSYAFTVPAGVSRIRAIVVGAGKSESVGIGCAPHC